MRQKNKFWKMKNVEDDARESRFSPLQLPFLFIPNSCRSSSNIYVPLYMLHLVNCGRKNGQLTYR